MTENQLIGPPPVSTPADLRGARGPRALPEDLLRAASRRLGVMSLLFAVLWVLGVTLGHLALHAVAPNDPRWLTFDSGDGIAVISVIVSLALYLYTRRTNRGPRFVLDLGLSYMVYTAVALGVMFHLGGVPPHYMIRPEISWIGVVVLIFAAIVPTTPRKMLTAGIIAVSMNPVSMLI